MTPRTLLPPSATSGRRGRIVRQPAEHGKLDTLAGLMLWLTLTHGFAGSGIGLAVGLLVGARGGSA